MAAPIVMGRDSGSGRAAPLGCWLVAAIFLFGLFATGRANPSPISVEVLPLTLRPRTQAPVWLEVKLHSQSRAPIEGTLELQVWGEGTLLSRQTIPDLTLISGVSTQRLLLPPPRAAHWVEEVRVQFVTRAGAYDLGRFPLAGESLAGRHYAIGICRGDFGTTESQSQTWRALRPERLIHEERNATPPLVTVPVWLAAEDLPSPLGLCAFDVVVLEGPAMAKLSKKQLSDLAIWVEGGGSLCIVGARDLKPEHLAFIKQVAGGNSASKQHPMILQRAGLGRVVLANAPSENEEQLLSPTWTSVSKFLARVDDSYVVPAPGRYQGSSSFILPNNVQSLLLQSLPQTARMIPLPVMGAILGGFVFLIGPGEWFVLGRLRKRRWTWVTFPTFAVACTLLTVRAAEHYLGTTDQRSSIIITDYSQQGTALRENRLDLWFVGRNQDVVVEKHQALAVPFTMRGNMRSAGHEREPVYEGRVPGHYTVRQPLAQWTPYLQRTLSFTPNPSFPRLHWEAVDFGAILQGNVGAGAALALKLGAEGWTVHVFGLRGSYQFGPPEDRAGSVIEDLSIDKRPTWATSLAPSGRADLLDLALDKDLEDYLVLAHRQVGRELHVQRCIYRHPDASTRF